MVYPGTEFQLFNPDILYFNVLICYVIIQAVVYIAAVTELGSDSMALTAIKLSVLYPALHGSLTDHKRLLM